MKAIHWIIAAVGLAFVLPVPAWAAIGDPEVIIYRVPGVRDDGGAADVGVATVFHCTNFSGVDETIRFVTRNFGADVRSNVPTSISHLQTQTAVTHAVAAYGIDLNLTTGLVNQGTTAIAATSTNII